MVSKDQSIGGLIFIVCVVVGVLYFITVVSPSWFGLFKNVDFNNIRLWLAVIPVLVAFIAIMGIGAWIGWTMATTPPPKPIEELTTEKEEPKEETQTPQEEKKEEVTPPPPAEEPEENKPVRKRKGGQ